MRWYDEWVHFLVKMICPEREWLIHLKKGRKKGEMEKH